MSKKTKKWRELGAQVRHNPARLSELIPSERVKSVDEHGNERIVTEPASAEKRERMLRAMRTPWKRNRR